MSKMITIRFTEAEVRWLELIANHGSRQGQFDSLPMGKRDRAICKNVCSKVALARKFPRKHSAAGARPADYGHYLTGKQLRFAYKNKLKVRYVEKHFDPRDWGKNYNADTLMTPARDGVFIGPSDLDLSQWKDFEPVFGSSDESIWAVYPASGKTAADYCKPF